MDQQLLLLLVLSAVPVVALAALLPTD